jgi:hypothetical protein
MIDCQLETPHLRSMGGRFIPYEEYLNMLNPGAYERLGPIPDYSDFYCRLPDEVGVLGDDPEDLTCAEQDGDDTLF